MNETLKLLNERKSVRDYAQKEITKEEKRAIFEAAVQAPTAGNMTLYTILDITDQSMKDRLAVTCDNQPFIAKAPMVLVFCADYRRWIEVFEKCDTNIRKPEEGDMLLAQADAIIAAQSAVIAAESMGIGSCYIGDIIENFELHQELLKLPDYVVPACMVCFGYPTEQQKTRQKPTRFQVESIVHENGYQVEKADAAAMEEMLNLRQGDWGQDSLADWVRRFCKRKWNSEFSVEMSRSAREMIKAWCGRE